MMLKILLLVFPLLGRSLFYSIAGARTPLPKGIAFADSDEWGKPSLLIRQINQFTAQKPDLSVTGTSEVQALALGASQTNDLLRERFGIIFTGWHQNRSNCPQAVDQARMAM